MANYTCSQCGSILKDGTYPCSLLQKANLPKKNKFLMFKIDVNTSMG